MSVEASQTALENSLVEVEWACHILVFGLYVIS